MKKILSLAILATLATTANAQYNQYGHAHKPVRKAPVALNSGIEVGAYIGSKKASEATEANFPTFTVQASTTVGTAEQPLRVGGEYSFHTEKVGELRGTIHSVAARGAYEFVQPDLTMPITPYAGARVGYSWVSLSGSSATASSKGAISAGPIVGVKYDITPQIAVDGMLNYDYTFARTVEGVKVNGSGAFDARIGGVYKF